MSRISCISYYCFHAENSYFGIYRKYSIKIQTYKLLRSKISHHPRSLNVFTVSIFTYLGTYRWILTHSKLISFAENGKQMLIDIDNKSKEEVHSHLLDVIGKTK